MVKFQWLFNDTHGFVNMLSPDFYSTHSRTMKIIKSEEEHFLLRVLSTFIGHYNTFIRLH